MDFQRLAEPESQALSIFSRFIKFPPDREYCADYLAARISGQIGWELPNATADDHAFAAKGLKFIDFKLTPSQIAEIAEKLKPGSTSGARFEHSVGDILAAPYLLDLALSEPILSSLANYLGCPPLLANLGAWWSFVGDGQGDQVFHRDIPSIKFCKLFIYLTDVGLADGPHQFLVGSHRFGHIKARLANAGSSKDLEQFFATANQQVAEELILKFLPDDLVTITGPAGTAFLEDTYGIHKAVPPTGGSRLIFNAQYAMTLDATGDDMAVLKARSDWHSRIPDTRLARHAVSPWIA